MRYITVEDLSFYYDKEPVLEHINYSVDSGEFVTLTGENGAAKTTLIKASLGILQPRIGKVTISKTNTQGKKLRIAYLPQQIASFNAGFPSTVYEFVKSGRYPRKGWFRRLMLMMRSISRPVWIQLACGNTETNAWVLFLGGKNRER